jgi:hypothetical protein
MKQPESEPKPQRENISLAVVSTMGLAAAYAVLQLFYGGILWVMAYLTDFRGEIIFQDLAFFPSSEVWTRSQVVALYLIPMLFFIVTYFAFYHVVKRSGKADFFRKLFYSWFYQLVAVQAFFVPFVEIVEKRGVYYALSWLGFSRVEQYFFAVVLMSLFLFRGFRFSVIFSFSLKLPEGKFLRPGAILFRLFFLWLIPVVFFTWMVFTLSGYQINYPANYLLAGIAFLLLLNLPVISNYDIVVKY